MTDSSSSPCGFLGLPQCDPHEADFVILPLPFEGTVSYGGGTARGPGAVLSASEQVELWDDELLFELDSMNCFTADTLHVQQAESAASYLSRVQDAASAFSGVRATVIGVGGEHSLTPPLVRSAVGCGDLNQLTVVQLDAHTDLRHEYEGTIHSHASAMRRLTEAGARLISIGIRATSREEMEYAATNPAIAIYRAQELATSAERFELLLCQLRSLSGTVYLTVDIDALDPALCPGTGTPEPGGLEWYPTLQILRAVLMESGAEIAGMDFVETVPMKATQVNEFTTARLIAKAMGYVSSIGR